MKLSAIFWIVLIMSICTQFARPVVAAPSLEKHPSSEKHPSAGNHRDLVVEYTQTGGFVATHNTAIVKEASLKPVEAKALEKAVSKSGILDVTDLEKLNRGAADVFLYDFVVESQGKKHHASYDDTTLPKTYSDLREFMRARAKPAKAVRNK